MIRFHALLTGLLLCLCTGQALAAPQINVGLNDVIAAVEKPFKPDNTGLAPISDMTADFFQRTVLAKDKRELRGDGRMSVMMASNSSPLMYRFEYFRPYNQEIVSDGKMLWIYHPENREVILSDVSFLYNHLSFDPDRDRAVNFLQGLGRISKDFQINFAPGMYDMAGNYVLELNPRRSMINTRRIFVVVDRDSVVAYINSRTPHKNQSSVPPGFGSKTPQNAFQSDPFPILSTTVDDQEGNSTTMEFNNIRINNRLHQGTFTFMVPPGVQVIKPSEQNLPR